MLVVWRLDELSRSTHYFSVNAVSQVMLIPCGKTVHSFFDNVCLLHLVAASGSFLFHSLRTNKCLQRSYVSVDLFCVNS